MVELLMKIGSLDQVKIYGPKLSAMAIMALVNMCNYNEDIKSIFRQKNSQLQIDGFTFIKNLLDSTDDEVLLNTLRLLMTNVKPKADDAVQHVKSLIEDGSLVHKIIYMIKNGPGIWYTEFKPEIIFLLISLLRIFLNSTSEQNLRTSIMVDNKKKETGVKRFEHTLVQRLLNMMTPEKLPTINHEIESAILALF